MDSSMQDKEFGSLLITDCMSTVNIYISKAKNINKVKYISKSLKKEF
jgi:hypothetical protein